MMRTIGRFLLTGTAVVCVCLAPLRQTGRFARAGSTPGDGADPRGPVVGPAVYYDASYDTGSPSGWEAIIATHRAAGQLPDDWRASPQGYYCAHPDYPLGTRLVVTNAVTAAEVVCVVADTVAPDDRAAWYAAVVIEMSYRAFVAAGGRAFNRFSIAEDQRGG